MAEKAPFLFGSKCPRSGAGVPWSSGCGQGHEVGVGAPPGARRELGVAGKGRGERSGLGHVVLVEVRYESIKNHLNCQNSCGESGAVRGAPKSSRGGQLRPPCHHLTCLSGAGPCLCPCRDVARALGSALRNNPRADRHRGANLGAAGCSRVTGWESAPEIGVFSWGKNNKKRFSHQ